MEEDFINLFHEKGIEEFTKELFKYFNEEVVLDELFHTVVKNKSLHPVQKLTDEEDQKDDEKDQEDNGSDSRSDSRSDDTQNATDNPEEILLSKTKLRGILQCCCDNYGLRFICGSMALFLYQMEKLEIEYYQNPDDYEEANEDGIYLPGDIDFMMDLEEYNKRTNRRHLNLLKNKDVFFNKGGVYDHSKDGGYFHIHSEGGQIIRRVQHEKQFIEENFYGLKNIFFLDGQCENKKNCFPFNKLEKKWHSSPKEYFVYDPLDFSNFYRGALKGQIIVKDLTGTNDEAEKAKIFVQNFDMSVAKIIYDIKENKFIFVDPKIEEDIMKKETDYHIQSFNSYIDRFGKKRLITRALKRILSYMNKGFKIRNPEGGYFDREEIWKKIVENIELQSNSPLNKDILATDQMRNKLNKYFVFYGFEKLENFSEWVHARYNRVSTRTILEYKKQPKKDNFIEILNSLPSEHKSKFGNFNDLKLSIESSNLFEKKIKPIHKLLEDEFSDISLSDKMNKNLVKTIIKTLIYHLSDFISQEVDEFVFSGSSVLFLESPRDENFIPGDLDVWIYPNIHKKVTDKHDEICSLIDSCDTGLEYCGSNLYYIYARRFREFMDSLFDQLKTKKSQSVTYKHSSYEEKSKHQIYTFPMFNQTFKVQFIIVPYNNISYSGKETYPTLNFDMEFCRKSYHYTGKNLCLVTDPYIEKAIENKASDYTPGIHNFIESGKDLILNEKSVERVNKYISRGYELFYMGKKIKEGSDVIIPNGVNENLRYFFTKRDF